MKLHLFTLDIDDCETNPCQNGGICVDQVNAFVCICISGWTGTICDSSKLEPSFEHRYTM